MKIKILRHNEINFTKWDECINNALNGIVYAYSWYLEIVAGDWDALVGDDYDAVFPLIHKRKYGINYLYQPYFTQQLGLFSKVRLDNDHVNQFINQIPSYYKYQTINFTTFIKIDQRKGLKNRTTYQLDLIQPYFTISSNFNENTRRNISKSLALGVSIVKGLSINEMVKFKRDNLMVPLKDYHFEMLSKIVQQSVERGLGEMYAAYTSEHELCAVSMFIRSNGKVIYLFAASNEIGRKNRAMFALIDHFINQNSESHLVLDFEGSMVESVARFYAGFGATPSTYQQLSVNKLPWFVKIFK